MVHQKSERKLNTKPGGRTTAIHKGDTDGISIIQSDADNYDQNEVAHVNRVMASSVMRLNVCMLLLLAAMAVSGCATIRPQPNRPLRTAKYVNVSRYAGRWYEVARLPNRFQRNDSLAMAEYTVERPDVLGVRNAENRPDGTTRQIRGMATAVPGSNGGRFCVKFEGFNPFVYVPREGNYWIIALSPDYDVSLVGTPDRKFLWLLSRQSDLSPAIRHRYLDIAKDQGFDTGKVLIAKWKR